MPTTAYAGLPPWKRQAKKHDAAAGFEWRGGVGTKKTGRGKKAATVDYVTGGWSAFNKDAYDQNVKKNGLYQFRLYNGRKSWVPGGDVDEAIGLRTMSNDEITEEVANYIEEAFDKAEGTGRFYEFNVEGPSHITKVRYNPSRQVMEVTFGGKNSDGRTARSDTVTFLRVPKEIMLTMEFANGKRGLGVDGHMRSLIGIKFWDLVRIRGTRRGVRYQAVGGSAQTSWEDYTSAMSQPPRPPDADPGGTQYTDAMREAAAPEHPKDDNVTKPGQDSILAQMNSGKYTQAQRDQLEAIREALEKKHPNLTDPVYGEWADAVKKGMGDVFLFKTKHKLWTNR